MFNFILNMPTQRFPSRPYRPPPPLPRYWPPEPRRPVTIAVMCDYIESEVLPSGWYQGACYGFDNQMRSVYQVYSIYQRDYGHTGSLKYDMICKISELVINALYIIPLDFNQRYFSPLIRQLNETDNQAHPNPYESEFRLLGTITPKYLHMVRAILNSDLYPVIPQLFSHIFNPYFNASNEFDPYNAFGSAHVD